MKEENNGKSFDVAQDKFKELELKCEEYLNNWKRAAADMANYKKEEAERAVLLINYTKEDVLFKILPILDSIYLAQTAFGQEGFVAIQKQITDFLKKEGIEEIEVVGKKFNPEIMEVVATSAEGSGEPKEEIVIEELQKGYIVNNKVLRPAKVKISK